MSLLLDVHGQLLLDDGPDTLDLLPAEPGHRLGHHGGLAGDVLMAVGALGFLLGRRGGWRSYLVVAVG